MGERAGLCPNSAKWTLVIDDATGEAGQDRRESGPPQTVRHVPASGDCSITCSVRAGPGIDRKPASTTAKTSMTKRIRMSEAIQQAKMCPATDKSCLVSWFRRHKRPLGEDGYQIDLDHCLDWRAVDAVSISGSVIWGMSV